MPARTAPCSSCGRPVPTEMLACPSCGTVVAPPAVSGPERVADTGDMPEPTGRSTSTFVLPWAPTPDAGVDPLTASVADPFAAPQLAESPSSAPAAEVTADEEPIELDPTALPDLGAPPATYIPGDARAPDAGAMVAPDATGALDAMALPAMHAPVLSSASMGGSSRAGAYLPPSAIRTASGASPQPASAQASGYDRAPGEAASPGEWPPASAWPPPPVQAAPPADAREVTEPAKPLRPGHASLLSDLPFDPPDDLPGWLVAAGSIAGAVAFLLPWSPQVLGSPNFGTEYWGQWGLGAPSHLAPFLLILALAMLTILPNALPAWLKTGVLPLVMGAFLVGLLWPYLVGGFGSRIGATVEAFAAFLLIGGGVVAIAPRRGRANEESARS